MFVTVVSHHYLYTVSCEPLFLNMHTKMNIMLIYLIKYYNAFIAANCEFYKFSASEMPE